MLIKWEWVKDEIRNCFETNKQKYFKVYSIQKKQFQEGSLYQYKPNSRDQKNFKLTNLPAKETRKRRTKCPKSWIGRKAVLFHNVHLRNNVVSVVISPFSLLIILIWVFSLFFLMSLANGLSILFIFSKNQLLVLLVFAIVSFIFFHLFLTWENHNSKRVMYHNVHCSFIYNSQDMETTKCPLTDEWIKKMWHIYTMEYYSAIKGNEIELFVVRWMDLETVIQSEVRQKEKNKYRMLTHIYGI